MEFQVVIPVLISFAISVVLGPARMQQLYEFQTGSRQKNCFHERF